MHEHKPILVIDKVELRSYNIVDKNFSVEMDVLKSHRECSECKEVLGVEKRRVVQFCG